MTSCHLLYKTLSNRPGRGFEFISTGLKFIAFGETFGFRPELRTLNFDILTSFSLVHILKRHKRRLVSITHIEFPDTYGHICQEFKNLYAILFFSVL